MHPDILTFISKERICSLAVVMEDGTSHSAAVHYSFQTDPFVFYFQTSSETLKAKPFLEGKTSKASIVIGLSEQEWITFQLQGDMRMLTDQQEIDQAAATHYAKSPDAEKRRGPKTVFLALKPTWWRFTNFNTKPPTIITGPAR